MTQIVKAEDLEIEMIKDEEGYRVTINGQTVNHLDLSKPMSEGTANVIVETLIKLAILGDEEGTNSVH